MSTTTSEIDDYVSAVHAALADMPDAEREDLLDDLPQHLADVQADAQGGALVDLIGTPQAYATELRTTAGLDADPDARPRWQAMQDRLRVLDERLGAALGYDRFVDLLRALAPAWWVVRGWLLAEFVTGATGRSGRQAMVPAIGGNRVAGVVLLVVAVAASVWLGRRALPRSWQRTTVTILGIAVALYGFALVRHAFEPTTYYVGSNDSVDGNDVSGVSNVYPVGPDGTVLKGIRLFDQDGNPIALGPDCPQPADDGNQTYVVEGIPSGAAGAPTYPQTCPADAGPFPSGTAPALPATSSPAPVASATPPAAIPTSGTPTSAIPTSGTPTSGTPTSGTPTPSAPATPPASTKPKPTTSR